MRCRGLCWVVSSVGILAFAAPVEAQNRAPAVWYRASETCPAGPEFLTKLAGSHSQARLAGAGDHIDFVVTLLSGNTETVGRLERQTNGGTVAIREVRDATCDRVADALALSLGLALDPSQPLAEPPVEATATGPEPALAPVEPTPVAPVRPAPAPSATAAPERSQVPPAQAPPHWFVGLDAALLGGLATQPLFIVAPFADYERALPGIAPDLAFRFAALGALGSTPTTIGSVYRWVLGGRAELCPVRWGTANIGLQPCLAFELGVTGAARDGEAGAADRTVWAAPGAELRGSFTLTPRVRLEAGIGALAPLRRDQVFVGSEPLYRDAIIGVRGSLGVSVGVR